MWQCGVPACVHPRLCVCMFACCSNRLCARARPLRPHENISDVLGLTCLLSTLVPFSFSFPQPRLVFLVAP